MKKCQAGCKAYTGGEIYHHKDCVYYSESMSKLFDDAKAKLKKVRKKQLKDCTLLVLCKSELFFQKYGGDTITTWYPVGVEAASVISLHYDIPLSYDGGKNIDNDEVLSKAFLE